MAFLYQYSVCQINGQVPTLEASVSNASIGGQHPIFRTNRLAGFLQVPLFGAGATIVSNCSPKRRTGVSCPTGTPH
jgi:hypothetical protein